MAVIALAPAFTPASQAWHLQQEAEDQPGSKLGNCTSWAEAPEASSMRGGCGTTLVCPVGPMSTAWTRQTSAWALVSRAPRSLPAQHISLCQSNLAGPGLHTRSSCVQMCSPGGSQTTHSEDAQDSPGGWRNSPQPAPLLQACHTEQFPIHWSQSTLSRDRNPAPQLHSLTPKRCCPCHLNLSSLS